jgi:hypothetical protein
MRKANGLQFPETCRECGQICACADWLKYCRIRRGVGIHLCPNIALCLLGLADYVRTGVRSCRLFHLGLRFLRMESGVTRHKSITYFSLHLFFLGCLFSLYCDSFSVYRLYSVGDRVTSEWWRWIDGDIHPCIKRHSNPRSQLPSDQGLLLSPHGHWGQLHFTSSKRTRYKNVSNKMYIFTKTLVSLYVLLSCSINRYR